jgi:hypothetical protein
MSSTEYGMRRTISIRSSKSTGTPCGAIISVPLIVQMPRFVAKTTMGASVDSRARFR